MQNQGKQKQPDYITKLLKHAEDRDFQAEFEAPVKRYAELSIQYEILNDKWYENGCEITEEYTNKSGDNQSKEKRRFIWHWKI